MTPSELLNIITKGENETTEFKTSFNKEVIETIVAFSNHKGGKVIIGVNDKKEIKGISVNAETIQKWINEIKQNTQPSVFPSIELQIIENNTIAIVEVNEYPLKPIAFKDKFFIRKVNSNHKLGIDEITEMRFISLNYSFDSFLVETKPERLNKNALDFFKEKIKSSGRYKSSDTVIENLVKLNILTPDKKLTRAAELLFCDNFSNIHIERFKTDTIIIDDIIIRSPLIFAVEEAIDFIKKNIRIAFEIGGNNLKRLEKWQYPIPALREILLNAIVHRDYTNPTDIIIKIFDEKIEITNPGELMGDLTVEKLLTNNYRSRHRNKLITEAFYLTGDIEKYGTGFKRIFEWLEVYPNIRLSIPENNDIFCVELISGKTDPKTDLKTDPKTDLKTQKIISLIKNNPKITLQEIASHLNKGVTVTKTYLSKLKKQGILTRIGPAKGGHWEIIE